MNNTVENDFFGFPEVNGYSIQVRWANVQATDVKFSQNLTYQNYCNRLIFDRVIRKIKRWTLFGTQCIKIIITTRIRIITIINLVAGAWTSEKTSLIA